MTPAPAPAVYATVDAYAADPDGSGDVLPGAAIAFEVGEGTVARLLLDFTDIADVVGDQSGGALLDGRMLEDLGRMCRHFRRDSDAGPIDLPVYDDGEEYWGHYGDDQPPDTLRTLQMGRTAYGDALVYLRLDLLETHGCAPTVWLSHHQLAEIADYASDLAGSM